MKTNFWAKGLLATMGSAFLGLVLATVANAANPEEVAVEVEWIAPVVISTGNALQFGMLDVAMIAAQTVTINTDNTYGESTANTVVGGTQLAATLTITVPDGTGITIIADNHLGAADYTLDTWVCSYNGGADTDCEAAYDLTSVGANADVKIGATLHALGGASLGTDDSTFDLTVTYQ